MNEKRYEKISSWFRKSEKRLKAFKTIYVIQPYIVILGYLFCIIIAFLKKDMESVARIVLVPVITFLACTVFRKFLNKSRPYERMEIHPLIIKNKKGQSFPSRHTVSAVIIAMSALYTNVVFGVVMLFIAMIVGALRIMAGVHYVKDVVAGILMGVLFGVMGFYIIL
ncbi:MAG: phosphatase PAP2 family protein [Lachnospiraceae bacterium]|nr:phosphatase PAP2 family protein [Lachnospiraceae bacterium]